MSAQASDDHDDLEAVVLAWLAQLYDNIDDGWLTLFSLHGGRGERVDWAPVDDYDALTEQAGKRAGDRDVWYGVATRKAQLLRGRGGRNDCAAIPAVWLDLDVAGPAHKTTHPLPPTFDDAHSLLDEFPLKPTAIVHSGHGLQPYWLLNEPAPIDEAAALLKRWGYTWAQIAARRGWHLDSVFDVARILRLPGTWNRKLGEAHLVKVERADWELRYGLDDIDQHLVDPPAPEPRAERPERPPGAPRLPGEAFNDAHGTDDILRAAGWQLSRADGNGDEHWTRPGKEAGTSATVYKSEDGHVTIWSSSVTGVETNRPYDAFGLYTQLRHNGDHRAASDELERHGYGTKGRPTLVIGGLDNLNDAAAPEVPAPIAEQAIKPAAILPDAFWDTRPALGHIRQAAHSRQRSADALLHITLARVAACTPHTLTIPAIVGAPASLTYFACVISTPGIGKSTTNTIAAELIPGPDWLLDQLPPGSGEGLSEAFFRIEDDIDPSDGKLRKVKKQVFHNAYVYSDEGQALTEMGGRKGSTLLPTLRSIWTGGTLGQANARVETHRVLPALSYIFGLTLSLQGSKAAGLLDDADGGTPQRFGWASAIDPTMPDENPAWPGPLDWQPPPRIEGMHLGVDADIAREVQAADKARARGEVVVQALDAHGDLYQLKVAALLAVLDKRDHINQEDWALARLVRECSNAVRDGVIATVAADSAMREQAATDRHVRREVAADVAVRDRRVAECARKITARVQAKPGFSPGKHRALMRVWRDVFDDGLDVAISEGWVRERTEAGQGTEKRVLEYVKGPS